MLKRYFLVIDAGNTTTHFGISSPVRIIRHFRLPSVKMAISGEAPRRIKGIMPPGSVFSGAIISSVVPSLNAALKALCRKTRVRPHWLSHRSATGIRLLYRNPAEIGADRIANVAAAKEIYGFPAVIVDIGTAITFDCVSRRGEYTGGIIAPGPKLTRSALAAGTGLLPFAEIARPRGLIGKSTVQAIQAGMIFGTRAMITGIVKELKKEIGGRPEVIFTGGQLKLIISGWDYPRIVDPLLTLNGLRLIYNKLTRSRSQLE